jgi:hypothetical protein
MSKHDRLARLVLRILEKGDNIDLSEFGISNREYDALMDAVRFLKSNFPNKSESWFIRAIVRAFNTKESGTNRWTVKGTTKFGDQYGYYRVMYFETARKYTCSCHNTMYGNARKRMICTHIAGVMIYKRWRGRLTHYMS